MKISIIIPVYNVENYIGKCLSSIYNQDLNECFYEVIVVNDGTQDNSMFIVNEFAEIHKNLRIVEKKNGGVSSARNAGLEVATGEYVTFVDADDWIDKYSLSKIISYLSIHSALEILICHLCDQNGNEFYPWECCCKTEVDYTGVEIYECGYRRGSVCGVFFSRAFLHANNLAFPVGVRNGEDSIFINITFSYVNKLSFLDQSFYVVYERVGSASRSFKIEHLKLMAYSLECAYRLMLKHSVNKSSVQRDILVEMLYMQISTLTYTSIKVGNFSLKQVLSCVDVKRYLPIKFHVVNRKGWRLMLLNFSYPLFYYLVKLKIQLLCFKH